MLALITLAIATAPMVHSYDVPKGSVILQGCGPSDTFCAFEPPKTDLDLVADDAVAFCPSFVTADSGSQLLHNHRQAKAYTREQVSLLLKLCYLYNQGRADLARRVLQGR